SFHARTAAWRRCAARSRSRSWRRWRPARRSHASATHEHLRTRPAAGTSEPRVKAAPMSAPLLAAPITAPARLAATLSGQGHAVLAPAGLIEWVGTTADELAA